MWVNEHVHQFAGPFGRRSADVPGTVHALPDDHLISVGLHGADGYLEAISQALVHSAGGGSDTDMVTGTQRGGVSHVHAHDLGGILGRIATEFARSRCRSRASRGRACEGDNPRSDARTE